MSAVGAVQLGLKSFRRGEKPTVKSGILAAFPINDYIRWVIRFLQFTIGVTVIGLYAVDLAKAKKAGKYVDSRWVYAVFCGSFSAIAAVFFAIVPIKAWFFFIIDAFIWFFWLVTFAMFGKMYIKEDPEGNKGIVRMKNAVWVDLTAMLLWFATAAWGGFRFWRAKKARTQHTGRAASVV